MKIARVIGRVVLNEDVYQKRGGRFLIASTMGKEEISKQNENSISSAPSFIVYDELGADTGQMIGITEGGEATRPFDIPMPVDAYNTCIIDHLNYEPA